MTITTRCRASRRSISKSAKSILNFEDILRYPHLKGQNHKSGYNLDFRVPNTQEELCGNQATKAAVGIILGAFSSGESQFHRGRCDISAANHANEEDLRAKLRHELLGHFGINTYNSAEKRAILAVGWDHEIRKGREIGPLLLLKSKLKNHSIFTRRSSRCHLKDLKRTASKVSRLLALGVIAVLSTLYQGRQVSVV